MLHSGYNCEGYYDGYNLDQNELKQYKSEVVDPRKEGQLTSNNKTRYEFVLTPNFGFLASPEPLLKDTELKLSFDRAKWSNAITKVEDPTTPLTGESGLTILDCYAQVEYVSSPAYRAYFDKINTSPIIYEYEECDVIIKSIPQNVTELRFDNLRGGNVPSYIFAGIIPQANLNGSDFVSCTRFEANAVREIDITLNGSSVNGYPIQINNNCPVYPLHQFLDVTGRLYDNTCGSAINLQTFKYNWIWAYKSEAEKTSRGWTGISFTLAQEYSTPMCLVVWIINDAALSIDKFHMIEKINL